MTQVLTATDLRTLTLKDARAQTNAQERALLRGSERERFASWLDRLEAETRERLNLLDADYQAEVTRRNGRMTEDQKRTLQADHDTRTQELRADLKGIYQRIDELTRPAQDPPIVQLRTAITGLGNAVGNLAPPVKHDPTPVQQDTTGWLSIKAYSDLYHIPKSTVWQHAKEGKLDAVLIDTPTGKQWRIKPPATPVKPPIPVVKVEVPESPPASVPEVDTSGWLPLGEASVAYGLSHFKLSEALRKGQITGVKKSINGKPPQWLVKPPEIAQSLPSVPVVNPPLTDYEQELIAKIEDTYNLGSELVESLSQPLQSTSTVVQIALTFSPALFTIIVLLALIAVALLLGQVQYYLP